MRISTEHPGEFSSKRMIGRRKRAKIYSIITGAVRRPELVWAVDDQVFSSNGKVSAFCGLINRMGRAFGATLVLGRAYSGVPDDTGRIGVRSSRASSASSRGKFAPAREWQISPSGGV